MAIYFNLSKMEKLDATIIDSIMWYSKHMDLLRG